MTVVAGVQQTSGQIGNASNEGLVARSNDQTDARA